MMSIRNITGLLSARSCYWRSGGKWFSLTGRNKYNDENADAFNTNETEEFDPKMYRRDAYIMGKTVTDSFPLRNLQTGAVFGYEFTVDIANERQSPIYCSVKALENENLTSMDYIATNIKRDQKVEVKGFYRKQIREKVDDMSGEKEISVYYSIEPESIQILEEEQKSFPGDESKGDFP